PDPEAKADELLLDRQQRLGRSPFKLGADIGLRHGYAPRNVQPASGGLMPLKNSQEISRPTHVTKPNRLMTWRGAGVPKPSCHSFLKLDRTPIEKNVRMKKITLNVLASPIAAGTFEAISAGVPSARERPTRKVTTKPRVKFGESCQISAILAFSAGTLLCLVPNYPS